MRQGDALREMDYTQVRFAHDGRLLSNCRTTAASSRIVVQSGDRLSHCAKGSVPATAPIAYAASFRGYRGVFRVNRATEILQS